MKCDSSSHITHILFTYHSHIFRRYEAQVITYSLIFQHGEGWSDLQKRTVNLTSSLEPHLPPFQTQSSALKCFLMCELSAHSYRLSLLFWAIWRALIWSELIKLSNSPIEPAWIAAMVKDVSSSIEFYYIRQLVLMRASLASLADIIINIR